MDAARIRYGDIIHCDVRGDEFYAIVTEGVHDDPVKKRVVTVESLTSRPIPTMLVQPRQIKAHWRKTRRKRKD